MQMKMDVRWYVVDNKPQISVDYWDETGHISVKERGVIEVKLKATVDMRPGPGLKHPCTVAEDKALSFTHTSTVITTVLQLHDEESRLVHTLMQLVDPGNELHEWKLTSRGYKGERGFIWCLDLPHDPNTPYLRIQIHAWLPDKVCNSLRYQELSTNPIDDVNSQYGSYIVKLWEGSLEIGGFFELSYMDGEDDTNFRLTDIPIIDFPITISKVKSYLQQTLSPVNHQVEKFIGS